jgi:hypothetical protein
MVEATNAAADWNVIVTLLRKFMANYTAPMRYGPVSTAFVSGTTPKAPTMRKLDGTASSRRSNAPTPSPSGRTRLKLARALGADGNRLPKCR